MLSEFVSGKIDVLAIAETKLDDSFPEGQFLLSTYKQPYRLDISEKSGGLLVYVNSDIPSRHLTDISFPDDIQAVPIELNLRKQKWLIILLYTPPSQNKEYFLSHMTNIIDFYTNRYDNYILIGDFNLEPNTKQVAHFLERHCLTNLVKDKTCFKSPKGTCIDLILTNRGRSFQHTSVFETGLSDHHLLIYTMLKTTFCKLPPKIIKYRNYRSFNEQSFLNDLSNNLGDSTNYDVFQKSFENVLDVHAPLKERKVRGNNKPHMSKRLRQAIMKRSRLKNRANKTGSPSDILLFKKHRNFVARLNKIEKREFFQKQEPNGHSSKSFWNYCKPFFSKKALTDDGRIVLVENESIISKDTNIANLFNKYFNTITSTLSVTEWGINNEQIHDPIERAIARYTNHPSILRINASKSVHEAPFSFSPVSPDETYKIISSLNSTKATSGNIPVKILKLANDVCHEKLSNCINTCIATCTFPDKLKLADIIPIFKKDCKSKKENYRPISILPTISKVYERHLLTQLEKYSPNILSPYLCGFRKGYSTQHALLNLLQNWQRCLDKSGVVGTVLMDLSKAYDCISPNLLIAKLAAYGFDRDSLKLLYNYMTYRKQRVKIGSSLSNWLEIILGLPQGSILGPILFNLFINDLILTIQETYVCNFADDTTLYSCERSLPEVFTRLKADCDRALQWFHDNSMEANPNKFQMMFLGTSQDEIQMTINGENIKSCKQVKLLGVTIDSKLTFIKHINNICCTASKRTKALLRIRKFLSLNQARCLLESYILSSFRYCPLIWMFGAKSGQTLIEKVYHRALRALYQDFSAPYSVLLLQENRTTIHVQNIRSLMTEVYKCTHNLNIEISSSYFVTKHSCYSLRKGQQLELPPANTIRYGVNSFLFRAAMLWNGLPKAMKDCNSVSSFQDSLKKCSFDTCTCSICRHCF